MEACRVQFKKLGKRYFFATGGIEVKDGVYVVPIGRLKP